MMARFRLILVGAGILAAMSGAASAVTMQAVYTGTVFAGSDLTNVFGAGSSLDGLSFRMTFAYDPETPGASRTTDAVRDEVFGGPVSGFTSPMRSAKLTINKHTERFRTDSAGVTTYNIGTYSVISHGTFFEASDTKISKISQLDGFADSSSALFLADLDASVPRTSLSLAGSPSGIGHFFIGECAFNSAGGCDETVRTIGTLAPSSLAIAPIPLPAGLPLLASGLAVLGFAGLRQRRDGRPAAA
jgi:hypothetical protein